MFSVKNGAGYLSAIHGRSVLHLDIFGCIYQGIWKIWINRIFLNFLLLMVWLYVLTL